MTNNLQIFFDTETSGFISKKIDAFHRDQAWAVQIGAILSTKDEIISELNVIIKANGRTMNKHAQDVHKISPERADAEGISELEAISMFAEMLKDNPKKICHHYDFDSQFVAHLFERNMDQLTDEHRSKYFIDLPHFCTMKDQRIKTWTDARNVKGALKWPRLEELYFKLFEENFPKAHDAMADTIATRKCYYELIERGVITV